MIRFILLSILLTIAIRAAAGLMRGVLRGLQGGAPGYQPRRGAGGVPQQGVQMVRDPVCGTFVVPGRAVALSVGGGAQVYFCSTACRDKYRSRPDARPSTARSRTA